MAPSQPCHPLPSHPNLPFLGEWKRLRPLCLIRVVAFVILHVWIPVRRPVHWSLQFMKQLQMVHQFVENLALAALRRRKASRHSPLSELLFNPLQSSSIRVSSTRGSSGNEQQSKKKKKKKKKKRVILGTHGDHDQSEKKAKEAIHLTCTKTVPALYA